MKRGLVALCINLSLVAACSDDSHAPTTGGAGGTSHTGAGGAGAAEPIGGGLGPSDVDPGPLSHGGTITFQEIGAPGWYPSRRDPAVGPCDAYQKDDCCLARQAVTGDALTPWDSDLIMTLRGPLLVNQLAVYQPSGAGWSLVSAWTEADKTAPRGVAFHGNDTETAGFDGRIGTECLVDVSSDDLFACGAGSSPYCPEPPTGESRYWGWSGSKLIVMLASAPHATDVGAPCSADTSGNWYDAPWVGLSLGELVRAGAFSSCQCYAKNPDEWYLGDGCGQFNVFEVVNDNNQFKNLDVFSTNFFGYAGYVGEGPCGPQCDVSSVGDEVDLIDKSTSTEAASGAVATPSGGPGAALRRPVEGWRYFVILLDATSRTTQLALVHPLAIPPSLAPLLPALPEEVGADTIVALRDLRLPN
ncbi:MAG: DUF2403 domain-containing lipoprotein [Polyangiaceae bacterium]